MRSDPSNIQEATLHDRRWGWAILAFFLLGIFAIGATFAWEKIHVVVVGDAANIVVHDGDELIAEVDESTALTTPFLLLGRKVTVSACRQGYECEEIQVVPGFGRGVQSQQIHLEPLPSMLVVASPFVGAEVRVNGVISGLVPVSGVLEIATMLPNVTVTVESDELIYRRGFALQPGSNVRIDALLSPSGLKRIPARRGTRFLEAFYLQEHEVTQGAWNRLMRDSPPEQTLFFGQCPDDYPECQDCPVHGVSFFQAVEYANRLSDSEGLSRCYATDGCRSWYNADWGICSSVRKIEGCTGFRLPDEAEWEHAASVGSGTYSYCESSIECLDATAWQNGNSGGYPHPVARLEPNAWGLHDMVGNVREFVWQDGTRSVDFDVSRHANWAHDDIRVRGSFARTLPAHAMADVRGARETRGTTRRPSGFIGIRLARYAPADPRLDSWQQAIARGDDPTEGD